jgi:hypothetical protein
MLRPRHLHSQPDSPAGSANDYEYGYGDPVNNRDVAGTSVTSCSYGDFVRLLFGVGRFIAENTPWKEFICLTFRGSWRDVPVHTTSASDVTTMTPVHIANKWKWLPFGIEHKVTRTQQRAVVISAVHKSTSNVWLYRVAFQEQKNEIRYCGYLGTPGIDWFRWRPVCLHTWGDPNIRRDLPCTYLDLFISGPNTGWSMLNTASVNPCSKDLAIVF